MISGEGPNFSQPQFCHLLGMLTAASSQASLGIKWDWAGKLPTSRQMCAYLSLAGGGSLGLCTGFRASKPVLKVLPCCLPLQHYLCAATSAHVLSPSLLKIPSWLTTALQTKYKILEAPSLCCFQKKPHPTPDLNLNLTAIPLFVKILLFFDRSYLSFPFLRSTPFL